MSYIQFESATEKDKIRQELREAREQMLEKAKKNAELRATRETQKVLSGESSWMLPGLAKKFDKNIRHTKKIEKKTKSKSKKKGKSKSKHKKRRHKSSSSEASEESDTDSSSEEEDKKSRKKSKRAKKKRKQSSSDSDSSDGGAREKGKIRKKRRSSDANTDRTSESIKDTPTLQRDSWMTGGDDGAGSLMLKTFARDRPESKPNEKQDHIAYDPTKSTRELNPYWKMTGTGLPAFQKPKEDSDEEDARQWRHATSSYGQANIATKSWRKPTANKSDHFSGMQSQSPNNKNKSEFPKYSREQNKSDLSRSRHKSSSSSSSSSSNAESNESDAEEEAADKQQQQKVTPEAKAFLTDQQMNELGAKIVKAEIMGNEALANELKLKLENARENRSAYKEQRQQFNETKISKSKQTKEEHILLTTTDKRGNTRPLLQAREQQKQATFVDPRDLYGGRRGGRKKKDKRIETHMDGERVRYFPDDDKYDIKQMFEREKYSNAADSNLQFANIASKNKNPNDDLEDIFADKVRQNIPKEYLDKKEYQRAVHEHHKLGKQLENCNKCLDSEKMDKKLIVSMGEKVYLTLPWHIGLQPGHCLLVPTQHASCCTQLDEDTWEEVNNFRKALTRMFAAQHKDVIFFEIANKLHRRPHLSIHCVPIPDTQGEMAPFYFKKAIEESEHEWSVNKQLVSLRQKGLRSCIPKGLPYFWVNFGMDSGFAHVIEDQERFPQNFALEIIGGMLHLEANKWRKPQKDQNVIAKVKMFADWWKKYDCTA